LEKKHSCKEAIAAGKEAHPEEKRTSNPIKANRPHHVD